MAIPPEDSSAILTTCAALRSEIAQAVLLANDLASHGRTRSVAGLPLDRGAPTDEATRDAALDAAGTVVQRLADLAARAQEAAAAVRAATDESVAALHSLRSTIEELQAEAEEAAAAVAEGENLLVTTAQETATQLQPLVDDVATEVATTLQSTLHDLTTGVDSDVQGLSTEQQDTSLPALQRTDNDLTTVVAEVVGELTGAFSRAQAETSSASDQTFQEARSLAESTVDGAQSRAGAVASGLTQVGQLVFGTGTVLSGAKDSVKLAGEACSGALQTALDILQEVRTFLNRFS